LYRRALNSTSRYYGASPAIGCRHMNFKINGAGKIGYRV
jgi:hypothetical protein